MWWLMDADAKFMEFMDRLYNGNENPAGNDFTLEEDDDHGIYDPEADVRDEDIGKGFNSELVPDLLTHQQLSPHPTP